MSNSKQIPPPVVLTDKDQNLVHIKVDAVQFIGLWKGGQMNIFDDSGSCIGMHKMDFEIAKSLLEMLQTDLHMKGDNEFVALSMGAEETEDFEYTFFYNTKHVQSYTIEKPRRGALDSYGDKDELLTIGGQGFGIPFTPCAEQKKRFFELIDTDNENWITLSPDAAPPFNTTEGEFHIRKDAIVNIAGYLLGKAIFDLSDGSRIFVPIAKNPARTQHIEIAKQIDTLKPIGNGKDFAYVNPEHFDPQQARFKIIDFGKGRQNALLMYAEDWHLPFKTVEDAIRAVENFVSTYQNKPGFKLPMSAESPEEPDGPTPG